MALDCAYWQSANKVWRKVTRPSAWVRSLNNGGASALGLMAMEWFLIILFALSVAWSVWFLIKLEEEVQ